jgi:nitrogen fixation/metabolism regulation signal transduction histidine kinase
MPPTKVRKLPIRPRRRAQGARETRGSSDHREELHRLAHEIANQLTVITLSCFKVRGAASNALPPSSLGALERVESAVAEIAALIESLRRLADKPKRMPQPASSQQPTNVYPLF